MNGFVSDANKIRDYLTKEIVFEPSLGMLRIMASRQEIVRLFKEHLGKAARMIRCFLFLEGSQEWADRSTFQSESDGRVEDIASSL